jgi:hypothetical protein
MTAVVAITRDPGRHGHLCATSVTGMRRLIPALSLTLAALLAGCGTDSGNSGTNNENPPASSAPADPVAVVQQAMQRSLSSTLAIDATVKVGSTTIELHSETDPAAKVLQVTGKAPQAIEARVIGDTAYLKMAALQRGKPWTKIDLSKLRPTSSLRQSFDIEAQTGIIGGIANAEEVGDGRYRGTADLTKAAEAAGTNTGMRDSLEAAAKLAKDPKAIPFEATVDAEGRLTELSYTVATKELGDMVSEVGMSGFGEPVKVDAPPAGQTEEADAEMYRIL